MEHNFKINFIHMKVAISKYAGFCGGVKRAYDMIAQAVNDESVKKPIVVLGALVHNDDVVKRIEKMGVKKIQFDGDFEKVRDQLHEEIGTLVITAHGAGPEIFEIASEKKFDVVDTTCPKVVKVQRLAQVFSKKGFKIVIIGENKHKEVQGIFKWANKDVVVIEGVDEARNLDLNNQEKVLIVSQTTQSREKVREAVEVILKKNPSAQLFDTICDATKNRQEHVVEIAKNNDIVFVIGSPESSNSNRLFEIAKENNSKTYFIERVGDIKDEWIEGASTAGVAAGASSPDWVIDDVVKYLRGF